MVRRNVSRNLPHIITGARSNLTRLHPDWSEAKVEAGILRFVDNVGRLYGEFAVLHRLISENRVSFDRAQIKRLYDSGRPIVAVMLHTGNWEVFGAALADMKIPISSFYKPPDVAMHTALARATRARLGIRLLEPNALGVRKALRLIAEGQHFAMFGDEARDGETMAPLFGRPAHQRGNLGLISRFARGADALVVIGHCVRLHKSHFSLHLSEAISLAAEVGKTGEILDDVTYLNERIEPIIRMHADQWYFLDNHF